MTSSTRRAGVLLHPTSLPGSGGIGTIGDSARSFIDFIAKSGFSIWQVLPLTPPASGNSPYSAYSAFAGNPMLIDTELLVKDGLVAKSSENDNFDEDRVDFERLEPLKESILRSAARVFFDNPETPLLHEFWSFCDTTYWLHDYALFQALKKRFSGKPWTKWPKEIMDREKSAVEAFSIELGPEIGFQKFVQWQFSRQWASLKQYSAEMGVELIGDLPIFVAHDSADVWCNRDLFLLDDLGNPTVMAGVPPDYFSKTGQLWGNPLYDWERMAEKGYSWWISRIQHLLTQFDTIRIDHFRGFEAAWHVPRTARTAAKGNWIDGPKADFFIAMQRAIGTLPFIAEDLGVITTEVELLRDCFSLPGMKILQFAFDGGPSNPYLPHNHVSNCVVYTGTHDNDTTAGWFSKLSDAQQEHISSYLGCSIANIPDELIRAAMMSVADISVIPMQDILNLGSEARMNIPGTVDGNWRWRYRSSQLTDELASELNARLTLYGRTVNRLKQS